MKLIKRGERNVFQFSFLLLLSNFLTLILFYEKFHVTDCLADDFEERSKTFYYYKILSFEYASNFLTPCLIQYVIAIFFISIFYCICFYWLKLNQKISIKKIFLLLVLTIVFGHFVVVVETLLEEPNLFNFTDFFNLFALYFGYFIVVYLVDIVMFTLVTIVVTFLFFRKKYSMS
ncbi:hypothetical protein ACFFLS_26070 [Flavobacterium procerum]|uniref:Uncharacterized protein n=1 Tax=Flavobacterium procerum TaxID=1455569 RepID=A0ABV6C2P2_9FLAO